MHNVISIDDIPIDNHWWYESVIVLSGFACGRGQVTSLDSQIIQICGRLVFETFFYLCDKFFFLSGFFHVEICFFIRFLSWHRKKQITPLSQANPDRTVIPPYIKNFASKLCFPRGFDSETVSVFENTITVIALIVSTLMQDITWQAEYWFPKFSAFHPAVHFWKIRLT